MCLALFRHEPLCLRPAKKLPSVSVRRRLFKTRSIQQIQPAPVWLSMGKPGSYVMHAAADQSTSAQGPLFPWRRDRYDDNRPSRCGCTYGFAARMKVRHRPPLSRPAVRKLLEIANTIEAIQDGQSTSRRSTDLPVHAWRQPGRTARALRSRSSAAGSGNLNLAPT